MPQPQATMTLRSVNEKVSIIDLEGEITAAAENALMDAYTQACNHNARVIILNFSRMEYMNSSGIGLLVTSLLSEFPLEMLAAADHYGLRRQASPAHTVLDSSRADFLKQARSILPEGTDLTLELSGSPEALGAAITLTRFSGRIVIGSWYGEKRAPIDLGGLFHRSRLKLISSQVSTIAPELSARWDKQRFAIACSKDLE